MRRLAACAAVVALLGLAGCGSSRVPAPSPALGQVVDVTVPSAIANLPLTKSDGTTTTLAAYRGRPVMIADFMTLCSDICPMISANTAAVARALAVDGYGDKVALLEISFDPQRDTLARLRAYRKLYGPALPDWTLLRASPVDTAKLWRFFGVAYRKVKEPKPADIDWWTHKPLTYDVEHSDDLVFLDAAGHERFVVDANPDVQGHLPPATLVRSLSAQGRQLLRHPDPVASWTVSQGLSVFGWLLNHRLPTPS
ncbi:MAG: SCO family protein [Mycobacteriales bacterium]